MSKLKRDFFQRDTCLVAQELLGRVLVFGEHRVCITETEAYHGFDDPASHAFRGKTKRTAVMFGEAGFSYVYLIYGMYHCLNVVTESVDFPAAVLIRGGVMLGESKIDVSGPGKLCRALGINLTHNAIDLINSSDFYFLDRGLKPAFKATTRIGIRQGLDKPWRFVVDPVSALKLP